MALNILVVDDSAVMRSIIVKALRVSGLPLGQIHEAGNGVEGLAVLSKHWIDLALVDINMPIMNGEQMIQKMREDEEMAGVPVVVVSTESSELRIEMLQQQGVGFVHKPFTPEILKESVGRLTGVTS
jgi:two-component system chemotaxis response regulator CheY